MLMLGNGAELWCDDLGIFGAAAATVEDVSLPRLRRALAAHARIWGEDSAKLWLSTDSPRRFNDEKSQPLPYALVLRNGELVLALAIEISDDEIAPSDLISVIEPLTDRWNADVLDISPDQEGSGAVTMFLRFPTTRRAVRDAIQLGEELVQALQLLGASVGPDWVRRALDTGLWDLLLGLDETSWLEAKRQHYREEPRDELNFASDVAAFCNAAGGLLIVGAKTKTHPDGDRIVAINQCPLPAGVARRYRRLLQKLVFPIPRGISISAMPNNALVDTGLLVIEIPEQPAELRPFFVTGSLVAASTHGAVIGIPVRHDADVSWMSPAALHARLRIGRAALGD